MIQTEIKMELIESAQMTKSPVLRRLRRKRPQEKFWLHVQNPNSFYRKFWKENSGACG